MDYEKLYNEALERAKKYKLKEDLIITQDIFPELAESEDERVRKFIIGYFGELVDENSEWGINKETRDKILAWLEKQGENNTDKIIERARTEKQRVLLTETNGAPEKIYLFENPVSETPDDRWLSKRSDDTDVEYTRTDAFIEKAVKWIDEINNYHHIMRYSDSCEPPLCELIEWFKNYMKGE